MTGLKNSLRYGASIGAKILTRPLRDRAQTPFSGDMSVINIVSPAAHGSLGDEALVVGSSTINDLNGFKTALVTPGTLHSWQDAGRGGISTDDYERFFGMGWSIPASRLSHRLVVIGADSVDGVYGIRSVAARIRLLNRHASRGGDAHLANFSLRESPTADAVRILRNLDPRVQISARDAKSRSRAEDILDRKVTSAPDVAQYLPATHTNRAKSVVDQIRAWRESRPVAVIVPNAHYGILYGSPDKISRSFQSLVHSLSLTGYAVVVLAHDLRQNPGDPALVNAMVNGADPAIVGCFIPESATEAKSIIKEANVVVTGRMHAAVAALSQDVPVLGLDYVDKFAGQFAWYGQASSVVPWQEIFDSASVIRIMEDVQGTTTHAAAKVRNLLPKWLT